MEDFRVIFIDTTNFKLKSLKISSKAYKWYNRTEHEGISTTPL